MVAAVFPADGAAGVPFAYTTGLSEKGLPELAIYGLSMQVAVGVLNSAAERMVHQQRGFGGGERVEGLLAEDQPLVAVQMNDRSDLAMGWALYGAVPAAVQLVWPDGDGKMPWEDGSRVTASEQPVLGVAPAGREVFRATRLPVATVQELAELFADQPKRSLSEGGADEDVQRDNDIRAGWGARALVGYATHLGGASLTEEMEMTASDLLGDLLHLFDAVDLDWRAVVERAERSHRAEVLGEL